MHNVSPGSHARPFGPLLKCEPLPHSYSDRVVDPTHSHARREPGDDAVDHHIHWVQEVDFHSAPRFPRIAFAPTKVTINVGELIPCLPVGKHLPSQLLTGFGCNAVLKPHHSFLLFSFLRRTPL